jgi:hypothetical protein
MFEYEKSSDSNNTSLVLHVLRQWPGKALKNCLSSINFDSKTDSKTDEQQRILVDYYGHKRGKLSVKWTLVDLCV